MTSYDFETTGGSCPNCGQPLKWCSCGEKALLEDLRKYRAALERLVAAEDWFVRDTQTPLADPVSEAVEHARAVLNGDES